jgi:anti-sigma-K factor RskA
MSAPQATSGRHGCDANVGAWVLGALEPDEADAFRRHLGNCPACREKADALESVVRAMALTIPQHPVPRRLRRRVLRQIRDQPRTKGGGVSAHRSWPGRRTGAIAAGLLAAVAIAIVLELVPGAGTRVVPARVSSVAAAAQVLVTDGHGELVVRHLSPPPAGHVYEVWLEHAHGNLAPGGVLFSVTATRDTAVGLPGSLRAIDQVLVTTEPDGGSPVPTSRAVIVADLTRPSSE